MDKQKFLAIEAVRQSGETNMFNTNTVMDLCEVEVTREEVMDWRKNYGTYSQKYL